MAYNDVLMLSNSKSRVSLKMANIKNTNYGQKKTKGEVKTSAVLAPWFNLFIFYYLLLM